MCTGETVDQSNCVQLPRDIMCLPIGSMLLRSKILWMKHVVFWREPDGVIPRATGDWLTGRWDSRKVLRHCHNTWKTSTYARRCWSSRFWHSDWKSGLFPDFYRKYSKVRTFPGPGGQQLKIRTFPGNKDPWEPCIKLHHFINNHHGDITQEFRLCTQSSMRLPSQPPDSLNTSSRHAD